MKTTALKAIRLGIHYPLELIKSVSLQAYINAVMPTLEGRYKGGLVVDIIKTLNTKPLGRSIDLVDELSRCAVAAAERGDFDEWLSKPVDKFKHVTLSGYRPKFVKKRWHLQLFCIPQGMSHPPHSHHDLSSFMVVLKGRLRVREFERLGAAEGGVKLKLVRDVTLAPFGVSTASEWRQNVHWFGADEEPVIGLNFNIRGYEDPTFLAKNEMAGRRYVDPTGVRDAEGVISAPFLTSAEAKKKFVYTKLSEFSV